jgi:DNA polymerase IV
MGRSHEVPRSGPTTGPPGDDTGCTVLHVDMDAFFVAVEVRSRPELRGRPVIVGGTGNRGVVSSASYEARKFGVRSAMPVSVARRLCPHGVYLPPDHTRYSEVSRAVMDIFRSVTPLVEPISLDEAFLDVAGAQRLIGRPSEIGRLIRERVVESQRITCSVGVASTKFVAKLASTRCKPDGLQVVPVADVLDFLHPLPVNALWGVGERTAASLARLGLKTVGDLAALPLAALRAAVGDAASTHLHELAWGRDPRRVSPDGPDKSIGAEETFETDVTDRAVVHRELLRLAERSTTRLRATGQVGRTVSIKVRFADFTTLNRSRTLNGATDVTREVYETARDLYDALGFDGARIRLVGVRIEGLGQADGATRQLVLGQREHGWREAEQAIDEASRRFGNGAVRPGTLLDPSGPSVRPRRNG